MSSNCYILSSNINLGVVGDDSPELSKYFELGWELAITRIYFNLLVKNGLIDLKNDFVVTSHDRSFLYSKYCDNVITYQSFLNTPIDDYSNVHDLTTHTASEACSEIFKNYMTDYLDDVINNKINLEFDLKDPHDVVKNNNDYVCLVVRKRDHCSNRSMTSEDVDKIINFYIDRNISVYILGKDCEDYDNGVNVFNVSYQDFASLINSDKCLKMITPLSGGGMIRLYTGTCPLYILDMANEYNENHVLLYGQSADLSGLRKNNLFNLVNSVEEIFGEM